MLAKLEKLQSLALAGAEPPFNPAELSDPFAMQVEWNPVKSGGANFRTHKLAAVHSDRLEFQASLGAKLFYGIFVAAGVIVPGGFLAAVHLAESDLSEGDLSAGILPALLPLFIGAVFVSVGGALLYFGTDRHRGYFWRGRKAPHEVINPNELKNACRLDDIHALQLLSEYCRSNKSSYYSYELNLVLRDGNRLNVVDHGDREKIRDDAQTLSAFLNRPVWDAIPGGRIHSIPADA